MILHSPALHHDVIHPPRTAWGRGLAVTLGYHPGNVWNCYIRQGLPRERPYLVEHHAIAVDIAGSGVALVVESLWGLLF